MEPVWANRLWTQGPETPIEHFKAGGPSQVSNVVFRLDRRNMVYSEAWNTCRIRTGDLEHTDMLTLQRTPAVFYPAELSLADTCTALGLTVINSGMLAWENVCVWSQQLTSKIPACKKVWMLIKVALMTLLFSRYSCQRAPNILLHAIMQNDTRWSDVTTSDPWPLHLMHINGTFPPLQRL